MEISAFCSQSRVLIVAGKGGVGKTTMVAALAHLAARTGLSVLVVELEGRAGVATAFGSDEPLDYAGSAPGRRGRAIDEADDGQTTAIPKGTVQARTITPDDALLEYLADHGMRRISKRLMSSGIVDIVAGPSPASGTSWCSARSSRSSAAASPTWSLVDAPATGHTMTFLSSAGRSPRRRPGGPDPVPGRRRGRPALDPARCQVALVTLPEEMPVNEVIEAAYQLEDKVGIALGPVIVNGCYPAARRAQHPGRPGGRGGRGHPRPRLVDAARGGPAASGVTRQELQGEQLERLAHDLPLPQLRVPFLFTDRSGRPSSTPLARPWPTGSQALPDRPGSSTVTAGSVDHRRGGARPVRSSSAADRAGWARPPPPPPSPSRRPGSGGAPAW